MADTAFFEITFPIGDDYEVDDRQDIEEHLGAALKQAGRGRVSGGGTGMGEANIEVDVTDAQQALALVRPVLQSFPLPPSTMIREAGSPSIRHPLHAPSA